MTNLCVYTIITEKIKRDWNVIEEFVYSFALQTGNESSVDRLMKQISSFMSEISDEFKIVVVDAIRLAFKLIKVNFWPTGHATFLWFHLLTAKVVWNIFDFCRSLCLKFPRKHHVMMNFLSSMLRDEVSKMVYDWFIIFLSIVIFFSS